MSRFYYEEKLSQTEREVIRSLKRGLSSCEREFSVPRLDTRRLGELYEIAKLDDEYLFHVGRLSFRYDDRASSVTVRPEYSMKKQEYENTVEIIKKRLKKILAPAEGFSPLEAERFIHDYIVKNVKYDMETKVYSHEVTGPLCHGVGVCEGMAKTFRLMCGELGVECIVVTGVGVPPERATGKKSERHAWNIVFLDGSPYAVDVTFDASLSKGAKICYRYFNTSDGVMAESHGDVDRPVPKCQSVMTGGYKC